MSLLKTLRSAASPVLHKAETLLQSGEKAVVTAEHGLQQAGKALQKLEHGAVGLARDVFDQIQMLHVTGKVQAVPASQLKLKADFHEASQVNALTQSGAFQKVSLADLPLDRTYVAGKDRGPDAAIPSTGMQHQSPTGFTFDAADQKTSEWMPQAVTTSAESNPQTGTVDGKKWVAVTWHHDDGKRSRISFVDDTNPDDPSARRYRNVELMVPDAKHPDQLVPLASHVGGVSWVGNYLYVAQTGGGVRVFDVNQLLKVSDPSKVPAGTEPYVLPQVGYYHSQPAPGEKAHAGEGSAPLFSGLSVDRTGETPALLSQEYDAEHPGGRIVRWPIDPKSGLLQDEGGVVQATDAWSVPLKRLAGIVRTKDGFEVATMGSPSGLWQLKEGETPKLKDSLAQGIQQFSYDSLRNQIWTLAEHPGKRMVWTFNP